jgi:transposase InsO family protein/transposase
MATPQEFEQLTLACIDPLQRSYEGIRAVVLDGETIAAWCRQTGQDRTTVSEKARRFVQQGMLGLQDQRPDTAGRTPTSFPEPIAAHILSLKQMHPAISYREIVRILERKFGFTTNHMRVKRFLDAHAIPVQLELNLTHFHAFADAYRARWTVVTFWAEGWRKASIAAVLRRSRKHVHEIITAFEEDGFAGLEDRRTRPPDHPANQLSLPFMDEVRTLQHEYPAAGRFRIHGLLDKQHRDGERATPPPSERTVGRAMATNRAVHGAPDPQADLPPPPKAAADDPQARRYRGAYRHHLWFIDLRYLVKLETGWVYSLCIIDGYARKILAGMVSVHQDVIAVVQLLHAALSNDGCPVGIVSDNGAVFTSRAYRRVLHTLGIAAHYIEKGRPWQNLIEAQFGIQRRLLDAQAAQATTADACSDAHTRFVETYNTTAHWAHRDRPDGRRTPADVLDWVTGRWVAAETLQHALRHLHITRTVNQHGFVSIQRFAIYAERGLARQRVAVWVYDDRLRIEHQQTLLAQYAVTHDRRARRLKTVTQPTLADTAYADPQLELFELDETQWKKVFQRPARRSHRRPPPPPPAEQLALFDVALVLLLCPPWMLSLVI